MRHAVRAIRRHPDAFKEKYNSDLALLEIFPAIRLEHPSDRIVLHNASVPVPPNTSVTTSGWGTISAQRTYSEVLRSITVPTISVRRCKRKHNNQMYITNKNICTYDPRKNKYAGMGDAGNPLVFHNQLIGVLSEYEQNGKPDIFVNLDHPQHRAWIVTTLLQIA
ncbi:trypsin 5G1-like [Belonocnema kinseyi]|uniref:trypsin 5G1-like n=1 Tax=Belonocnema kinseyi TaxID=2817044 RepID=UPI00143DD5F3|nr:trypsin 5G1-like [Belonocnema kinseyi]